MLIITTIHLPVSVDGLGVGVAERNIKAKSFFNINSMNNKFFISVMALYQFKLNLVNI